MEREMDALAEELIDASPFSFQDGFSSERAVVFAVMPVVYFN